MQAQQAPLIFTETERQAGDRLLKLALETDRVEGYTEAHAVMIAQLAETIGQEMGLHGADLSALKFAALAHDIGERGMKRNYLLSPNVLSWEERLDLWRHPILGEQAVAEIKLSRHTQLLVRWHHEWWNGQGYPDGLSGTAIPLGARILRAADSYCALISQRPYRQSLELAEAEQTIADLAGIEFDPQVAKVLLAVVSEERLRREAEQAEAERQRQEFAGWNIPPAYVESPAHMAVEESYEASVEITTETAIPAVTDAEEISATTELPPVETALPEQTVETASQLIEEPATTDEVSTAPEQFSPDQAPTSEFPAINLESIQPETETAEPTVETEAAEKPRS
ncbi:MAG: HD domain-containing phosphohydrolase [Acidobacteriota bacterium]|nr:HD domain-containing phosphohydrolase [Acidobacteriota bacterium]